MSSILYKFRSGTTFEALPLPGTAARLFDVKRAIVKAKKLDVATGSSQLEFDLSVRNATTQEEYADESMLLPRGTRVVVQRLPAARGHGFLARMARAESGMALAGPARGTAAPSGFYTIESRDRDEEDEFVQSAPASVGGSKEEKEVAALLAVTDGGTQSAGGFRPTVASGGHRIAGAPPPPPRQGHGVGHYQRQNQRPNADPELRDQEQKQKKRATGIPRTFLNISAPPVTDPSKANEGEETEAVARLQPNTLGFKELVNRGGGQSENASGTRRDLDYALKLTATTIPEHLQCGICHSVVKNAMLLPWDPEGRTACESCIRDALTQNGFRCPLTGIEGVSPDDLHPNYGLRKAAELFIKTVMDKMEEIEKQQVDEAETGNESGAGEAAAGTGFEGDSSERGVILSRKTRKDQSRKQDDDDPFGGGDADFGGDVFDVAADNQESEDENVEDTKAAEGDKADVDGLSKETSDTSPTQIPSVGDSVDMRNEKSGGGSLPSPKEINVSNESQINQNTEDAPVRHPTDAATPSKVGDPEKAAPRTSPTTESAHANRREARRRGPPAGYVMGPAGGAAVRAGDPYGDRQKPHGEAQPDGGYTPSSQHSHVGGRMGGGRGTGRGGYSSPQPGRGGYPYQDRPPYRGRGRGRSGRGRFQQGDYGRSGHHQSQFPPSGHGADDRVKQHTGSYQDDDSRGTKRSRSESEDHNATDDRYRERVDHSDQRDWQSGGRHNDRPYGGGDRRFDLGRGAQGGYFRGGYGGRRGGRGNFRGRGYGRGRY